MSDQTQNTGQADQAQQEATPLFNVGDRAYTADDAAKKIQNADSHINTLEQERRADKERIAQLEAELKQKQDLDTKLDSALESLNRQPTTTETTPPVDIEKLKEDLINQVAGVSLETVQSYEQQKIAQANQEANISAAKQVFGEGYEAKLREIGTKFGYDDEGIRKLAAGNPEFFKQVFNLNKKPDVSVAPNGSHSERLYNQPKNEKLPNFAQAWDSTARVRMYNEAYSAVEQRLKREGKI